MSAGALIKGSPLRLAVKQPASWAIRLPALSENSSISHSIVTIGASDQSLIIDDRGVIIERSTHNIGYRVSFLVDGEGNAVDRVTSFNSDYVPIRPLAGNVVDLNSLYRNRGGTAVTDQEGRYFMSYLLPPCPGITYTYPTHAWLTLRYRSFNPRSSGSLPYFKRRFGSDFCNGLSVYDLGSFEIVAAAPTPGVYNQDFPIDLMVLSGRAQVTNEYGDAVPMGGQTQYNHQRKDLSRMVQAKYDFDGDGEHDFALPGKWQEHTDAEGKVSKAFARTAAADAELQGIWLSSRHQGVPAEPALADTPPDLTRLMDWGPDFDDRALLSELSVADLENTDLYIFRESNGQMILERKGLSAEDKLSGVDADNGLFAYTLRMRGAREYINSVYHKDNNLNNFQQLQAKGGMNPELYARQSDHLRPGERVKIVALNRATGYIGTLTTTMQAAGSQSGNEISFAIGLLKMGPPNLKIWAERKSTVEQGLSQGQTRQHAIGNEGAGLGSDEEITITSEWLDRE